MKKRINFKIAILGLLLVPMIGFAVYQPVGNSRPLKTKSSSVGKDSSMQNGSGVSSTGLGLEQNKIPGTDAAGAAHAGPSGAPMGGPAAGASMLAGVSSANVSAAAVAAVTAAAGTAASAATISIGPG